MMEIAVLSIKLVKEAGLWSSSRSRGMRYSLAFALVADIDPGYLGVDCRSRSTDQRRNRYDIRPSQRALSPAMSLWNDGEEGRP